MHKEISRRQHLTSPQFLLGVFVSFIVLLLFNFLGQMADVRGGYIDLGTILFFTVISYLFIYKHLISYKYMLIGEEFIIQQMIGSKEKTILNIHVNQIHKICPIKSEAYIEDKVKSHKLKMKLYNTWEKSNVYYGVYEEDGKNYLFIFQPSDKMLELMQRKVCGKIYTK